MTDRITLFGPAPSSYVRTARMICVEKHVEHSLEPVDLGSPAHRALHPFARVPILRHASLQLFETQAIARYLERIGSGPSLVPTAAGAEAVAEQWISALNCYLYGDLIKSYALAQYILPQLQGRAVDAEGVKASLPALERGVALVDNAYNSGKWLAGSEISLADLFWGPVLATLEMCPEGGQLITDSKNLRRVLEQLSERPSAKFLRVG